MKRKEVEDVLGEEGMSGDMADGVYEFFLRRVSG